MAIRVELKDLYMQGISEEISTALFNLNKELHREVEKLHRLFPEKVTKEFLSELLEPIKYYLWLPDLSEVVPQDYYEFKKLKMPRKRIKYKLSPLPEDVVNDSEQIRKRNSLNGAVSFYSIENVSRELQDLLNTESWRKAKFLSSMELVRMYREYIHVTVGFYFNMKGYSSQIELEMAMLSKALSVTSENISYLSMENKLRYATEISAVMDRFSESFTKLQALSTFPRSILGKKQDIPAKVLQSSLF